jgi:hypothetical protein
MAARSKEKRKVGWCNMPSKTKRQRKFMAAVADNPKFAAKVGVPQAVGKEFKSADKRKAKGVRK